ncbi:acyltransferase [Rhizobium grahamii CCGE 502]|uniref:Acyltransferase n=1 Tax=Rhizobium grahamii CCGE 502 TaxID=990285 RepID=S3HR30_9HYPH|nr:acyltransferase [Rhizobium grahamii CCGE 502]
MLGLTRAQGLSENISVPIYIQWLHLPPVDFGAFGVAVFFLISGFVIPMSLSRSTGPAFLVARLFRIVPTYVVGFLISLAAIYLNTVGQGGVWPTPLSHVFIHMVPGLRDILGTTNIDGIIWTLEIEMKFYLVCALIAPLFRKGSAAVFLVPAAIVLGIQILAYLTAPSMIGLLGRMVFASEFISFMFVGTAFYYIHAGLLTERAGLLVASAIAIGFFSLWTVWPVGVLLAQAWNYAAAFLVFWTAFTFQRYFASNAFTKFFASISYPLYVVHAVAGYSLLLVLQNIGMRSSLALIVATSFAIGAAYLLHRFVEKPTQKLAKRLKSRPAVAGQLAPAE